MKPKTIVILSIIVLFLIILYQNREAVPLQLFFWEIAISRIILIPLTMLIGFILGYFVARVTSGGHKKEEAK